MNWAPPPVEVDPCNHSCVFGDQIEPMVFRRIGLIQRRLRLCQTAGMLALMVSLPFPALALSASPGPSVPLLAVSGILAVTGFGMILAADRLPSYDRAFRACGLTPLDAVQMREFDALLSSRPDLRPTVAYWVGYDLPLRERDLRALRLLHTLVHPANADAADATSCR